MQFQAREHTAGFGFHGLDDGIPIQQFQGLGQAIAPSRHGKYIEPQFAECLEMFPYGRSTDAQATAQLRTRVKAAIAQGFKYFKA